MSEMKRKMKSLPFRGGAAAEPQVGRCGKIAGQKFVLHALEVTGFWTGKQPAAGRPCRRHWMERVWTPPPHDTEHCDKAVKNR